MIPGGGGLHRRPQKRQNPDIRPIPDICHAGRHAVCRGARGLRRADGAGYPGRAQRAFPAGPRHQFGPAHLDIRLVPGPGLRPGTNLRRTRRPLRPQAAAGRRRAHAGGAWPSAWRPRRRQPAGGAVDGPGHRRARRGGHLPDQPGHDRCGHVLRRGPGPLGVDLGGGPVGRQLPLTASRRSRRAIPFWLRPAGRLEMGLPGGSGPGPDQRPGLGHRRAGLLVAGRPVAGLGRADHDRVALFALLYAFVQGPSDGWRAGRSWPGSLSSRSS